MDLSNKFQMKMNIEKSSNEQALDYLICEDKGLRLI